MGAAHLLGRTCKANSAATMDFLEEIQLLELPRSAFVMAHQLHHLTTLSVWLARIQAMQLSVNATWAALEFAMERHSSETVVDDQLGRM